MEPIIKYKLNGNKIGAMPFATDVMLMKTSLRHFPK